METKVEIKTEQYYYVTMTKDWSTVKYRRNVNSAIWQLYYNFQWSTVGVKKDLDEIVQNSGVINHTITCTQE